MKTSGRPFPSKYDSGRCPICTRRIVKGQVIVRLKNTANWWEDAARGGMVVKVVRFADYAHKKCLDIGSVADMSGVYEILNTTNGKRYVGSAVNLRKRESRHWQELRGGYHHNRYLQNAWNKYSKNAFVFRVLHILHPENLLAIEQGEIDTKSEYNICKIAGSNLGVKLTDEAKAKISAAKTGHKCSPETRARLSAANMGRKHTDEAKARMRGNRKVSGHKQTDETRAKISAALIGRKHTDEARAKISAAGMGRKCTEEAKAKMSAAMKDKQWSPARRAAQERNNEKD